MANQAVTELIVRGDGALATLDKFEDKMVAAGQASDRSTGAIDRYAAALAKAKAAQEKGLAITTQKVERLSAEQKAMERWQGTADPMMKLELKLRQDAKRAAVDTANAVILGYTSQEQALATLTKLEQSHAAQLAGFKQAGAQGAAGLATAGAAAKLTSNQMLNLSRQGNDVITMFALGAPPMQIFASQAGQIYDALEQGPAGIKGSLKAIGESLLGLITRFPVATAAIVAVGAAVVAYQFLADEKIKSVDEVLKQHEANIKRLGPAYEEAMKGLQKYADESAALANLRFRTDAADALRTRADEATKAIENMVRSEGIFSSRFSGAKDAIEAFMASIKSGTPEAVKFQETIAGLRESGEITEKVAQDLVLAANAAYEAERKLRGVADRTDAVAKAFSDMSKAVAADAVAPLSRLSDEQRKYIETLIDHLKRGEISADQFKTSLTSLSAVNPDFSGAISGVSGLADQLERAQRAAEGLANTTQRTRRLGAMDEAQKGFDDAFQMWRRFGHDDESGLKKQKKDADDTAEAYDRLISSAERRTFMMGEELKAVGKSQSAWEGYRFATDLYYRAAENAAKNNQTLTDKQIEQIKALGVEYIKLAQAIAEAQLKSDLMFERDQIGRTDTDQRVADAMRNLYGDDYQSHMNGAIAGQIRFNEELKKTGEIGKDAFESIIDALTSSGDLVDKLISAFAALGKQFQKIGSEKLFDYLTGKSSSLFGDGPSMSAKVSGGASVANYRASGQAIGETISPPIVGSLNKNLDTYAAAIRKIESGSYAGNYSAVGEVVTKGRYAGDRALGAYQVMGNNVAAWTKEATGVALTQKQFLNDRAVQDKVFYTRATQAFDKFGNFADVGSVWFTGGPVSSTKKNPGDGRTSVPSYLSQLQSNMDAYNPSVLKKGVSDGMQDASQRIAAANQNDPWGGLRSTSVATNTGNSPLGGMGGLGMLGMGVGSFASGMQSGDPLSGALGGALGGIAMGPVGIVFGAVAGLIGGLLGKAKQKKAELKKAQEELESQIGAITDLMRTATGNYLGAMEKEFGDTVDQFQKAIQLAEKAKNSKLVAQLKESQEKFFDRLVSDWNRSFQGTLDSLNAGLGMDGEFLKGMDAVDKMRESLIGFVNDAKFFAESNGDLSSMLDARKKALGIGQKGKEIQKPKDEFIVRMGANDNELHKNEFLDGYKELGLQLIEKGFQAFNDEGGQLYDTLTQLTDAATKMGFAIDEAGKVTRVVSESVVDAVAEAMKAAQQSALATLSGGKAFSEIEQAIQRLEGAAASLPELLKDLGMSAEDAAKAIQFHLNLALRDLKNGLSSDLQNSINSLSGFDYLNDLLGAQTSYEARVKDLKALGMDTGKAMEELGLRIRNIAKDADLTDDQLTSLSSVFPQLSAGLLGLLGISDTQSVEDAKSKLEEAQSDLRSAYDKEKSVLDQLIDRTESFIKTLQKFRDEMRLNANSPLSQYDQVMEAQKQFRDTAALAATGDEDAMGKLTDVSQNYLDEARAYYVSSEDYFKIWDEVDKTLAGSQTTAEKQLSEAQKQAKALEAQISALIDINDSVLSVADAIAALAGAQSASAAAAAADKAAQDKAYQDMLKLLQQTGQAYNPDVTNLYRDVLGRAPDKEGADYYTNMLNSGMSLADVRSRFIMNAKPELDRGYPQFAAGGDHMGGYRIVGERGRELEATGPSRIFNASETQRILQSSQSPRSSNDNSAVVAELKGVRQDNARLTAAVERLATVVGLSDEETRELLREGNSTQAENASTLRKVASAR